ncbi:MAG TPA: response regulator transcription factor [Candidatus Methylomirabilis sp.]|nr:response regulator transcription factor [Candidatus Methylomirabilis sp.]HSB82842.1 response regulator transcription factor [Candidatus Methylomirabilis sp.]
MPLRILLADDHPTVRQHVRALLEEEGYEVVGEAPDGRDAVQFARRLQPDLAILDVSMPRLNGFAAAEEILRETPQMRVLLLTVHAEPGYLQRAVRAGIRGYVLKSQMPDDLLAAIQEVARGRTYQSHILSETAVPV